MVGRRETKKVYIFFTFFTATQVCVFTRELEARVRCAAFGTWLGRIGTPGAGAGQQKLSNSVLFCKKFLQFTFL